MPIRSDLVLTPFCLVLTGDTALQSASDFADDMAAWLLFSSAAYGSANRETNAEHSILSPKTELLLRVFWDTKSKAFLTFLPRDLPACFWLLLMLAGSSALAVLATFAGLSGRISHGSEYWQYWDIWNDMKRWTIWVVSDSISRWFVIWNICIYLCAITVWKIVRSAWRRRIAPEWRTGTVQRFACRDFGGAHNFLHHDKYL